MHGRVLGRREFDVAPPKPNVGFAWSSGCRAGIAARSDPRTTVDNGPTGKPVEPLSISTLRVAATFERSAAIALG
jgi:hypothetical protein